MVPKHKDYFVQNFSRFRAVLFRMVPKPVRADGTVTSRFRAVLFRMVPKHDSYGLTKVVSFRAVLFRMVPKQHDSRII